MADLPKTIYRDARNEDERALQILNNAIARMEAENIPPGAAVVAPMKTVVAFALCNGGEKAAPCNQGHELHTKEALSKLRKRHLLGR